MKTYNLIGILIIFSFMVSCNKHETTNCIYDQENLIDSSLFLSYDKNGTNYKFYQLLDRPGQTINYFKINDSISLERISFTIAFDDSIKFKTGIQVWSDISFFLTFYYTKILDVMHNEIFDYNNVDLFVSLSNRLDFVRNNVTDIKDSFNLQGVGLEYNRSISEGYSEFSTEYFYNFYNNNNDSVLKYLKGSSMEISKIEKVCNSYRLIKGTFNTKVMNRPAYLLEPFLIEFKNVSFNFVLK
jgi:hypothetical protein